MPKCPKCKFELIEKWRRYKCSVCKKYFSKKEIDSKEFRDYNEDERKKGRKKWRASANKAWQLKNPEKYKEYVKKSNKKKKEKDLINRHKNNKKINQYMRSYYKKNKDKFLAIFKKYRKENKEKIAERSKKYYSENLRRIRVYKKLEWSFKGKEIYKRNQAYYKKYYQENKERILLESKKRRNSEIIGDKLSTVRIWRKSPFFSHYQHLI